MTTCFLAPDPIQSTFFIPGGNTPGNGVQVFFYLTNTTTKQTAYKDNAAASSWTNPIVLDSGGNLPSQGTVWFPQGQTFTVVWAPSNDTDPPASPYRTINNVSGINDTSISSTSDWISDSTPTFVSATSFTVSSDKTATYVKGRRIKTTNTAGTVYSTVVTSSFGAGLTTVTVVSDTGSQLDSGLSSLAYGQVNPAFPSINDVDIFKKTGSTITAVATTDIWSTAGDYVHVGSTGATIWSFSSAPYPGARREVIFDGSITINSSATLNTPRGQSFQVVSSESIVVRAESASVATVLGYAFTPTLVNITTYTTGIVNISTGAKTRAIIAEGVGGGGGTGGASSGAGSSAASGGGGSGAWGRAFFFVNPLSTYACVIGPGGALGAAGISGKNGTSTSLVVNGTTVIWPGGSSSLAVAGTQSPGGLGGAAPSSVAFGYPGQAGSGGFAGPNIGIGFGGFGGSTPLGGGGMWNQSTNGFGGGANGSVVSGAGVAAGNTGAAGAIIVYELG